MATSQVETVSTGPIKPSWLVPLVALVVAALAGVLPAGQAGADCQWGALAGRVGAAVWCFFTSEPGKELIAFGRDAWREVKKVVWPARKGGHSDDCLCVWLCGGHGDVFVADGQDA
jgi:preprotein translocase subunit SecE